MDSDTESNLDPGDRFLYRPKENISHEESDHLLEKDYVESSFTIIGNDLFFKNIYEYHQGSGFLCILLTNFSYLSTVLFTICFSTFLTTCVDWKSIHEGTKKNLRSAIYPMCRPEHGRSSLITFFFVIFIIWWIFITIRTVYYMYRMWKIREIWIGILGLSSDVKWVTWQMVIDRYHERIDSATDSHYVVNRIMRWDNYLIAMLTKDIFSLDEYIFSGLFTKVLEWNLKKCLVSALFRDDETLIKDVMLESQKTEYVARLRKTFLFYGIMNFLFAPFVICALSVYFIYRYVSEYHKNPKAMGLYTFTPLAKWKLRDFNELPHVYTQRLNKAHPKIIEYLGQFIDEGYNIVFKFFSFVLGATLLILVIVSFFNPDILISLFMTEQPILFYIGLLGALFVMVNNNTVDDEPIVYEPEKKFKELVTLLHCTPSEWALMSTREQYLEIRKLFRFKWIVFIQEILSVAYVWILLLFWFPIHAPKIVNFFRENSFHREKLGIICSCAEFNSNADRFILSDDSVHDNNGKGKGKVKVKATSQPLTDSIERKMENSILNFKESYPTWDPNRFSPRKFVNRNPLHDADKNRNDKNNETNYSNSNTINNPIYNPTISSFNNEATSSNFNQTFPKQNPPVMYSTIINPFKSSLNTDMNSLSSIYVSAGNSPNDLSTRDILANDLIDNILPSTLISHNNDENVDNRDKSYHSAILQTQKEHDNSDDESNVDLHEIPFPMIPNDSENV